MLRLSAKVELRGTFWISYCLEKADIEVNIGKTMWLREKQWAEIQMPYFFNNLQWRNRRNQVCSIKGRQERTEH